jgi:hypothetical protein
MRPCCPNQGVGIDARNRSSVLDACQLSTAGACNVHCAEGRTGVNETVSIAGGVGVVAGDLAGVVDAERGRAGGGKLIGVNTPAWSRKPWEAAASDHCPTMSPAVLIPAAKVPVDDEPQRLRDDLDALAR